MIVKLQPKGECMRKKELVEILVRAPSMWSVGYLEGISEMTHELGELGQQYQDKLCAALFAAAHQEVA